MSSSNFSSSPTDRNQEENVPNGFTDEHLVSPNGSSSGEVNVLSASSSGSVGFFDLFGPSSIFHPQPTHLLPNVHLPDGAIPCTYGNTSQNRAPWKVDSSNKMNQWPNRLFTITPPTPASSIPAPLPSLRLPLGQQDLAELQDPLQEMPLFTSSPPSSTAQSVLTYRNYQIFQDCRGNREEAKEAIFQEIYRLQLEYGELSLIVQEAGRKGPQYKCGVCNHPRTVRPLRTKNKVQRRWDLSPHILRHFSKKIKPWYCECGKGFARSHDRRRHSITCKQR
ncbi:hypothetical protein CPB86DRAFT_268017 [Serendipita vermifera]|nr:hypothetical protein CPB86DRAFT_268017 [Serendipita vermifera]